MPRLKIGTPFRMNKKKNAKHTTNQLPMTWRFSTLVDRTNLSEEAEMKLIEAYNQREEPVKHEEYKPTMMQMMYRCANLWK